MKATIINSNRNRSTVAAKLASNTTFSAKTNKDILFVFSIDRPVDLKLGDIVELDLVNILSIRNLLNTRTGESISIRIADNNVHDLTLPASHGGSRTPSKQRLAGN